MDVFLFVFVDRVCVYLSRRNLNSTFAGDLVVLLVFFL